MIAPKFIWPRCVPLFETTKHMPTYQEPSCMPANPALPLPVGTDIAGGFWSFCFFASIMSIFDFFLFFFWGEGEGKRLLLILGGL